MGAPMESVICGFCLAPTARQCPLGVGPAPGHCGDTVGDTNLSGW